MPAGEPQKSSDHQPVEGRITPRSFARTLRKPVRYLLAYWAVGLLLFAAGLVSTLMIRGDSYAPCVGMFVVAAIVAVAWEAWLRKRRARNAIGICHRCGYDLAGLPESGKCPECAQPYSDNITPPGDA